MTDLNSDLDNMLEIASSDPLLRSSQGVGHFKNQIEEEQKKGTDFTAAAPIITATNQAIAQFTKPDANAFDIVSGSLAIASSITLTVSKAASITSAFAGPAGLLLGLAGAILGAFGSGRNNSQTAILKQLLDDAFLKAADVNAQNYLEAALREMQTEYSVISGALDQDTGTIGHDTYSIRADTAATEGVQNLGFAWGVIEKDVANTSNHDVWSETAQTYYVYLQVMAFKAMYLTQSVAFFNRTEDSSLEYSKEAAISSTSRSLQDHLVRCSDDLSRFMVRPTLLDACLTNEIFRLPSDRFDYIRQMLYRLKSLNENKSLQGLKVIDYGLPKTGQDGLVAMTTPHAWVEHGKKILIPKPGEIGKFYFASTPVDPGVRPQLYVSKEDDSGAPYRAVKLNAPPALWNDWSSHPDIYGLYPVGPTKEERSLFKLDEAREYWMMVPQASAPNKVMGNNGNDFKERDYYRRIDKKEIDNVMWVIEAG